MSKATRSDAHYPDNETLIIWANNVSLVALAERCGVSKSSLRDYLKIRPDLDTAIRTVLKSVKVPQEIQDTKRAKSLKAWKANNRERVRAINRKWGKNQSFEKRQAWNTYNMNRRRANGTEISASDFDWLAVLRKDTCPYCFGPGGSLDHVQPLINGGIDAVDNLAGICRSCNSSKGSKDLLQFMLWRLENV